MIVTIPICLTAAEVMQNGLYLLGTKKWQQSSALYGRLCRFSNKFFVLSHLKNSRTIVIKSGERK